MTELEILRAELRKIDSYPIGLERVDCGIKGIGFFPGARGLWKDNDETLSNKSIMFLGHDFGAKRDYNYSAMKGQENLDALTWKNLRKAMIDYNLNPEDCFFTNCIMGIRSDGLSAVGKSPALESENFINDCKEFLIKQINMQRPQLIICLGLQILNFMSGISHKMVELSKIRSFKKLDKEQLSFFENVYFNEIPYYKTDIVFVTHPTYRYLNISNREFNGLNGVDAERQMIHQYFTS